MSTEIIGKHIASIQSLATENKSMSPRTAFLQVALGALEVAAANTQEHVAELERQAKAKAASLATLEAAKAAINQEEAAVTAN